MYFHIPKNKYIFAKRRKSGTFLLIFMQNAHIMMSDKARPAPAGPFDETRERETMELSKIGMAGTVESGDILVEIERSGNPGVEIQLDSTVMGLYGRQITQVIAETAAECGVDGVRIVASDKGALDCTIRARVKTAILRACDSQDYGWTVK